MRDDLLAYLLNDLDEEQRSRIEERLENDPLWQHELERLRSMIEFQEADEAQEDTLPTDLVDRTCQFVQKASAQGTLSPAVMPASLTESCELTAPPAKRWSMLDFGVTASILLIVTALILPALRESRDSARRIQCQEKLKELGHSLALYAKHNKGQLPAINRDENAGMYTLKLVESGVLTREQLIELLVCPSTPLADKVFNGQVVLRLPTRIELKNASGNELQQLLELMGGSFAYRIGYFDKQGNLHQVPFTSSSNQPMMADKPSFDVVGFQSSHHDRCGQNVLFQDESVRFIRICIQNGKDRHWFLNNDDQHAAGKGEYDVVMARSEAGPSGLSLPNNKVLLIRPSE